MSNLRGDSRAQERRACSLSLRLLDHRTGEIVGDIADISAGGFRLESSKPIRPKTELTLRMDLPPGISDKPFMVFTARSRWNRTARLDGRLYHTGFQITRMNPTDCRIFLRVFERYGTLDDQLSGF